MQSLQPYDAYSEVAFLIDHNNPQSDSWFFSLGDHRHYHEIQDFPQPSIPAFINPILILELSGLIPLNINSRICIHLFMILKPANIP